MRGTDRAVPSVKRTEVSIHKGFALEQKETAVAKTEDGLDFSYESLTSLAMYFRNWHITPSSR